MIDNQGVMAKKSILFSRSSKTEASRPDAIKFVSVFWYVNYCWLFKAKSCLYIIYAKDICFENTIFKYTQLNDQTVLFVTIQFSISHKVKWFQVFWITMHH